MSKYTYQENIYDFDGNAIGWQEYTVPNRIVEQIRADAIEEFITLAKNGLSLEDIEEQLKEQNIK